VYAYASAYCANQLTCVCYTWQILVGHRIRVTDFFQGQPG